MNLSDLKLLKASIISYSSLEEPSKTPEKPNVENLTNQQ
jgi:hypothetical protein